MACFHSQQFSSSNVRFAGYLFKRSNKPYDDSLSYDASEVLPITDERLEVSADADFQNTSDQSLDLHQQYDFGLVKSKHRIGEESNRHLSMGEVEPLLSSLPFVPMLPDLNVADTIKTTEKANINETQDATKDAIDLLSAFLGEPNVLCRYSQKDGLQFANKKSKDSISEANKESPPFLQPTKLPIMKKCDRTLPISIADGSATSSSCVNETAQTRSLPLHLQKDASARNSSDYANDHEDHPIPQSYIDPKDGHVWRAKYCVLVDGTLYFYSNAKIGNSVAAQLERDRISLSL
jgi:hypothetical protein